MAKPSRSFSWLRRIRIPFATYRPPTASGRVASSAGALRFWISPTGVKWTILPILAVTLLHYAAPGGHEYHLIHDVLRRLYYVPILAAGVLGGLRPGLVTAAVVGILYLPHVFQRWEEMPTQQWDAIFEILLFHCFGVLTGGLADALRRQRDSVAHADRLKTLGTMAAFMAHEVRNPLAAVRAAAERLGKDRSDADERRRLLDILGTETARLNGVVEDLLTFARPASIRVAETNLAAVMRETAVIAESVAREREVSVRVDIADVPESISADATHLKQALLNLMLNAVQAAPAGSEVVAAVRPRVKGIEFVILDRGPGVPADVRRQLFVPFVTGRPSGTGLGLAIARQIAEAHGGELVLRDATGGGTEAVLRIAHGHAV